jgi:hypothetical protein
MLLPIGKGGKCIVCVSFAPCPTRNYFSSFTSRAFTGAINSGEFQYIEHKLLNNLYAIYVLIELK